MHLKPSSHFYRIIQDFKAPLKDQVKTFKAQTKLLKEQPKAFIKDKTRLFIQDNFNFKGLRQDF